MRVHVAQPGEVVGMRVGGSCVQMDVDRAGGLDVFHQGAVVKVSASALASMARLSFAPADMPTCVPPVLSRFGMAGKMCAELHAVRELIRSRARETG
ncbi:hypothetical protein GCM10010404_23520 [Nonomuraea africana]